MRKFALWFLGIVMALFLLLAGAYLLAKKYEEPVRNYVVAQVNKRLESPVHVSDINFSLLERFPSASLVMDSVWARENIVKIGKADTLFFFTKVYLNLNIMDVLRGQYKINEIEVRDGFMHLMVDEQGYDNYHIWTSSPDTTGFLLELDKVHIENTNLRYINLLREQEYILRTNDLFFNGKFSEDNYLMAVLGDGYVSKISVRGTPYMQERSIEVEADLDITNSTENYAFRKGRMVIDDLLNFQIAGALIGDGVDLHITGQELDIIKTLSLIPTESRSALDDYSSSGVLSFDCTLKGAFGKTENPRFDAQFSLKDASISRKGSNWKLTDLEGSGTINNGPQRDFITTALSLQSLSGKLNDDPFSTAFSIANFETPSIDGHMNIKTDLQGIREFFGIDVLEEATGKIDLDASISTTLQHPSNPQARDFLNSKATGKVIVSNARIKLKDDHREYVIDTAHFSILNNSLEIDRYVGRINECEVELSGLAEGFLNYFFTEFGVLEIKGKIKTGTINPDELFPATSNSSSGIVVAFPDRAQWALEIETKAFVQGKFMAESIRGKLVMNHFKVEASDLEFQSQQGHVKGKAGVYRFGDNQFGILTDFSTSGVDIKSLFTTFNNFEQDFITASVLEGKLDADIRFQAFCDSLLNIDMQSIVASSDLRIENGALVGFEPLVQVADEIRKKPMLRLFVAVDELKKRLQDVRFATLENEISIRNGIVTIPNMEIRSSALNININGTHSFNNEIDYSMDFALSEVLQLKDRTEPYNEYVQRDESGRTRIYLTMIGTTDDFDVEIQRTTLKQSIGEKVREESNAVKHLLKSEFNSLSKDSIRKAEINQPRELKIDFDPEAGTYKADSAAAEKKQEESPKVDGKKGLNKLIRKTETNKKALKDGDFEDDDF